MIKIFFYKIFLSLKHLKIDKTLFFSVFSLSMMGVVSIYSASNNFEMENESTLFFRQFVFVFIGFFLMIVFSIINYRKLAEHSILIFLLSLLLLLAPFLFGKVVNNAKRWIMLGPFTFQTSELVKVMMIIVIAKYVEFFQHKIKNIRYVILIFIIMAIPIGLILIQPDLGTSIVLLPILLVILFLGGVRISYFVYTFIILFFLTFIPIINAFDKVTKHKSIYIDIITNSNYLFIIVLFLFMSVCIFYFINIVQKKYTISIFINIFISFILGLLGGEIVDDFVLRQYQKERLLTFINPFIDKLNAGYNVIQAQIAVGSGKLFGKGFLKGMQGYLGFLPSRTTDFLFSIISEEFGFVGTSVVIILFSLIIFRLFKISLEVKDRLGGLIVSGIAMLIFFQSFINIAMNLGIAPVTGLPLPFLSYGGSSIISLYIAIGIVQNIYNRKYINRNN